MKIPETPEEKLIYVREIYLLEIIPSIQYIYEMTNKFRECFILVHCAILSLSGFYTGSKETNRSTYIEFIKNFFSKQYNPDKLWKNLRNNLIHAYTLTSDFLLAHKHPEKHLQRVKSKSEFTGKRSTLTILNFEDFFEDFKKAACSYFKKLEQKPKLISNFCYRFDIAPPPIITKEDIP